MPPRRAATGSGARRLPLRSRPGAARRAGRMARLLLAALALSAPAAPLAAEILSARFAGETDRYPHGVLGDKIEYSILELALSDGRVKRFVLPPQRVFEDTAPRLQDLDGDGAPEVLAVESSATAGARLTIWTEEGLLTATPAIGRPFRWLAPLGAADLDEDGRMEIAYVDRPHLAKTLRIWRLDGSRLTEVAARPGFSNHRIGWDFIAGGIRDCPGRPPEMILADDDWQRVMAVTLTPGGELRQRGIAAYAGPESLRDQMACD